MSTEENKIRKRCLRCGHECDTAYCPVCGQQMNVPRLSFRHFFAAMATDLYLVNGGFLYTVANLLIRPWKVIREYIHGRREDYTSPVGVLVILIFIGSIITSQFGLPTSNGITFTTTDSQDLLSRCVAVVLAYINENQVFVELIMPIPALLVMVAVYWNQGARKYNMAEYLTAMIYLEAASDVFGLLVCPLNYGEYGNWAFILDMVYTVVICAICSYKAFRCKSHSQRILKYLLFLFITAVLYVILFSVLHNINLI